MRMRSWAIVSRMPAGGLELREGSGALVLDVAESVELAEVMLVRALPGVRVRLTPESAIIGRTRIGVERHGIVGPDAVALQPFAPFRHEAGIVVGHGDQVRLDERHA